MRPYCLKGNQQVTKTDYNDLDGYDGTDGAYEDDDNDM